MTSCFNEIGTCRFCELVLEVADEGSIVLLNDKFPVSRGHTLLVPKRHVVDPFELGEDEIVEVQRLLRRLRVQLLQEDPTIQGFNVGFNSGEAAGQTVMHAHIHLIPRRIGDTPSPRGGVRGVIPAKMSY